MNLSTIAPSKLAILNPCSHKDFSSKDIVLIHDIIHSTEDITTPLSPSQCDDFDAEFKVSASNVESLMHPMNDHFDDMAIVVFLSDTSLF